MKDLIALFIYGVLFITVITLFINLLPILIIVLIIFLVMRYFRNNKQIDSQNTYYEQTKYEDPTQFQSNGNIKTDVIDVEYKETVEK